MSQSANAHAQHQQGRVPPTILSLFGFWLFQIPLAYLLSHHFGMNTSGVYLAIVLAESGMAVVGILLFRKGSWKHVKV